MDIVTELERGPGFIDDVEGLQIGTLSETETTNETTIGPDPETSRLSNRRTSKKVSRFEIVCDNPDDIFDTIPIPSSSSSLEIVSRSIKVLHAAQEELYTSTEKETISYYLPRGSLRAKGATAVGRSRRKALLVGPLKILSSSQWSLQGF